MIDKEFASTRTEKHAIGIGFSVGLLGGLLYKTDYRSAGIVACLSLAGTALGIKALDKISNKKLTGDVKKEPHYALGSMGAGLLAGMAFSVAI